MRLVTRCVAARNFLRSFLSIPGTFILRDAVTLQLLIVLAFGGNSKMCLSQGEGEGGNSVSSFYILINCRIRKKKLRCNCGNTKFCTTVLQLFCVANGELVKLKNNVSVC